MFTVNILLALAWVLLTGDFGGWTLLEGFLLGYLVLWLVRRDTDEPEYGRRMVKLGEFALFFLREVIRSNIRVAYDVLTPRHHMRPAIVDVPLESMSDTEITILANMITLTPGTLSLDISHDNRTLYIHTMYLDDEEEFRRQIKEGFERRLLEVTR